MTTTLQPNRTPLPPAASPVEPEFVARYRSQGRRRATTRDGLTVATWMLVAVSVAFFLADGGAGRFGTLANYLTSLGFVSGLVATTLTAVSLVLAARVPLIDRTIGHDQAVALHARLGQWVFSGLVLHAVLLIMGYAATDGVGLVAEVVGLWGTRDFVLAVVGLALMAAVAVSSVVAARRRLPYEVWHVIHLLSYAAVLVSLPHQFTLGTLFNDGIGLAYWAALWTVVLGCLLTFRIFLPLFQSLDHRLVVSSVTQESPGVVSVVMTGRRLAELDIHAGQFLNWRFLGCGLWWHQHPFSLSAAPAGDTLRITFKDAGAGTRALLRVRPGTRVLFEGPYGLFSDAARTSPDVVLVGIGLGLAPVRAVLESTVFLPGHGTVIVRASSVDAVPLLDEIERLCLLKGARLVVLTGPRAVDANGAARWVPRGHEAVDLASLVPGIAYCDVYVCGPQEAADLVIAEAIASGVDPAQVHNERFAW